MRILILSTCGDSQREVEDHAQGRQGHCWKVRWTKNLTEFNSQAASAEASKTYPFLRGLLLLWFLKFFFFFPASCLSSCCRFKETGGGCIARWRMKKRKSNPTEKATLYHPVISFPKLWNRLQNSCSLAIQRDSVWCSLCLAPPLPGGRGLFHRTAWMTEPLLALCSRAGMGEGWQGSQGAESQEQGKGSRKTTKTDRVEEAGWDFKQSQPKWKAKAERYI